MATTGWHEPTARDQRSQLLFRQLNEQIRLVSADFGVSDELDLVCECGNGGCFERVLVPGAEYEAVRRFPTRFIVKPGHAAARVERVVTESRTFLVVERVGADAAAAILLDPRRDGDRP